MANAKRYGLAAGLWLALSAMAAWAQQSSPTRRNNDQPVPARLTLAARRMPEGQSVLRATLTVRNTTRRAWKVSNSVLVTGDAVSWSERSAPQGKGHAAPGSTGVLRPVVRYLVDRPMEMPADDFADKSRERVVTVAPGKSLTLALELPTAFLDKGPVRLAVALRDGARVAAATPAVTVEVTAPYDDANPPSAQQIVSLFRFEPEVTLAREVDRVGAAPGEGRPRWSYTYRNMDKTPYSIRISVFDRGVLMTPAWKRRMPATIREGGRSFASLPGLRNPFFTFETADGRTGYNYGLAVIGSHAEYTILASQDGSSELAVTIDYDGDLNKRLQSAVAPTVTGRDVVEALDRLIAETPARNR